MSDHHIPLSLDGDKVAVVGSEPPTEQEPVAWRWKPAGATNLILAFDKPKHPSAEPLYAAPSACREALEQPEASLHYLGAIKTRLESLYDLLPDDPRLREHVSDEVDWIEAEIERLRTQPLASEVRAPSLLQRARQFIADSGCDEDDNEVNSARDDLLTQIDAALSAAQSSGEVKPVAWRRRRKGTIADDRGWIMCPLKPDRDREFELQPLYAAPVASPAVPAYADPNFKYDERTQSYHRIAAPPTARPITGSTLYLERDEVRKILIGQPEESLYITEEVLREIDALQIFTTDDFAAPVASCSDMAAATMDSVSGGLKLLLAAVHANDPKREILVRIGDLMRDIKKVRSAGVGVGKP